MTLAQIQSYYFRRTKTNATNFPAADQVIALNVANEYVLSCIRDKSDNFLPTAWSTSDLSTGTVTPVFDAEFHHMIPLHVSWQWAIENDKKSANGFEREMLRLQRKMEVFYGQRQYRIFTVTIASPGVFTRTNHGLINGERIIFSTSGALPTGLSANTWYFAFPVTVDTFEVGATIDGTSINTTGSQSGTHWFARENTPRMTNKKILYI